MVETPIWQPSPARVASAAMTRFRERIGANDFEELHRYSVTELDEFWTAVWEVAEIRGDRGGRAFDAGDGTMRGARFFPGATLNFAQNLLRDATDVPAIIASDETATDRVLSRAELHRMVAAIASAMRREGVQPGDRVAAWMANVPETVAIMLAAASVGAVFSSTSPDFGAAGVVDRFGQIEPVLMFAVDGYRYADKLHDCRPRLREIVPQLPSVRRTVLVSNLPDGAATEPLPSSVVRFDDWVDPDPPSLQFAALPFDHPLVVLYSSGTTGPPKCIVHRAGGLLLKHASEHLLHCDVEAGDRVFYFTTCGWMMWNWLVSALAFDATILLYDGSPFHPTPDVLFDFVDRHDATLMGVSAKYLDALRADARRPNRTHRLASVRTICSTGSPLVAEAFDYVYDAIVPEAGDVHLASISGGTDLCGCLVIGDPTRPVYRGEIQGPALGVATMVLDDQGGPAATGETGELVCTAPFPSMPLGFWNDPSGAKYSAAYFERFAEGPELWAHGDFAATTAHGGFVIHGRSDATLNPSGVRIGTAELYRQVEAIDGVTEALAIGQPWDGDVRIVLFVRLRDQARGEVPGEVSGPLQQAIRTRLRTNCSPRHVPAKILAVDDLPRTRSGKLAELAVADVVAGRVVRNREALANPEALEQFANRAELCS